MPVSLYTHTTFLQLVQALAARLNCNISADSEYWKKAELQAILVQVLRMWNSLTAYNRQRGTFPTVAATCFYDLTSVLAADLFGYSYTDVDLLTAIQYHLLEPATGTGWTGSDQFTLAQVQGAMQRRRNQFLLDTGEVVTFFTQGVAAPSSGRFAVPDTIIDVRRLAWVDVDGNHTPLFRMDEFGAQNDPAWVVPGTPYGYAMAVDPPTEIQLIPPPRVSGTVEGCGVFNGASLDVTGGVLLGVQDDDSWAVMWGALADLLGQDGTNRDPVRAAYCEQMYKLGVESAKTNPTVLLVQVNDNPIFAGSVADQDGYGGSWQDTTGKPEFAGLSGQNLISFSPCPDDVYGVSLDLVANMPVPVADGDFVQVGLEVLDRVLDMGQHIAAFKQGGQEWKDTMALEQNFLNACAQENKRLTALAVFNQALRAPANQQEMEVPREGQLSQMEVSSGA